MGMTTLCQQVLRLVKGRKPYSSSFSKSLFYAGIETGASTPGLIRIVGARSPIENEYEDDSAAPNQQPSSRRPRPHAR